MLKVLFAPLILLGFSTASMEDGNALPNFEQPVVVLAQGEQSQTNLNVALNFVRATGLNKNFQTMIVQTAARTQTFAAAAAGLGKAKTIEALKEGVEAAVVVYGERWDRNLALTYLEFFAPQELMSLLNDRNASPYLAKLKSNRGQVGISMQEKSTSLLKDASTQVVLHVFETYTKARKEIYDGMKQFGETASQLANVRLGS